MGSLQEWLGPGLFKTLGPYLEGELGAESAEDLRMLEPEHLFRVREMLKPLPLKKFNTKFAELTGSDQPPSLPEGVAEKPAQSEQPSHPTGLHSAGEPTDPQPEPQPEPEQPPSEPASSPRVVVQLTSRSRRHRRRRRAFGSMRFDGIVPAEAAKLQQALAAYGIELTIINMAGGGDIDRAVQEGILSCEAFIVFGSAKYGEDTGNAACTYYESKFAQSQHKKIILIRMIPFNSEFEFAQAKFMFGLNMLELPWLLGTPMPSELPGQVAAAMGVEQLPAKLPAPPPLDPKAQLLAALAAAESAADRAQREEAAERARLEKETRVKAELAAALTDPIDRLFLHYAGGAARMGREGYTRYVVEVAGFAGLDDRQWGVQRKNLRCSAADGIDRAGFGLLYSEHGRDADADADQITDEHALRALVREATACGEGVRAQREALEAQLAQTALLRPLWSASPTQLVELMGAQQERASAVGRCCRQLNLRARGAPAIRDEIVAAGAITAVAGAMQSHPLSAEVQTYSAGALSQLALSEAHRAPIAAAGCVELLAAAMRSHPAAERVQQNCAGALKELALSEAHRAPIAAAGCVELLAAAMRSHPAAERLQHNCAFALGELALSEAHRAPIAAAGCVELLAAAMRSHPAAERVQNNCACALGNLALSEAHRAPIAAAGCMELLAAAMRSHPAAERVQNNCAYALGWLAESKAHRAPIAAAGCVELLAVAMRSHPAAERLQDNCAYALGWLAESKAHRAPIAAAGCVELLAVAMRSHPAAERLQQNCAVALGWLALSEAHRAPIAAAGCVELLAAAMRSHPAAERLQQSCAFALGELALSEAHRAPIAAAGCVELLAAAMRSHPAAESLQQSCAYALRSLRGYQ